MNMRKKYIALTLTAILSLTLCVPISVNAEESKVAVIQDNGRTLVPVKILTEKMGGRVTRNDDEKHYIFSVDGKNIKIADNIPFGSVNGTFAPFETRDVSGYKIPVYSKPIYKDGEIYVPITFLIDSVGLKLEAKDGQVAFETVAGSDKVATSTIPTSKNGSGSDKVDESNGPATKSSTPTGNGGNSGNTTTPTQPTNPSTGGNNGGDTSSSKPTTSQKPSKPKPKPQPTKIYTGSQVKEKLYGLGFTEKNGGLRYNPHGANADGAYDYATFSVLSGNNDMYLLIQDSDPAFDQKLSTIFSYILPSSGGTLYSILDNSNVQSQTIQLDGRTISIDIYNYGIGVSFGPIIK